MGVLADAADYDSWFGEMARKNWISVFLHVVSNTARLVGAVVLIATLTPLAEVWTSALARPWYDPGACDTLIVLAGSELDNGLLGYSSYWRSVYAVRAQRKHGFKQIVLSGGSTATKPTAESMADFLVASGVPPEIIRLETKSQSTRENALFTERLLRAEPGCKALMTSDYHIFRASRAFRKIGMNVRPTPLPDALKRASRWHKRWLVLADLTTETAKIVYYWWRGWI